MSMNTISSNVVEDRPCDGVDSKVCSQLCTNLNDTNYVCSCEPGYKLEPDGFNCTGT